MAKIKPMYKLNNGNGATLCHTCKVIISEGFTEDLYCKKCKPQQESFVEKMIPLQLKYNLAMLDVMKQETLEEVKDLSYYKTNAEEDYSKVPISVLRYISELEQTKEIGQKEEEFAIGFADWMRRFIYDNTKLYFSHSTKELLETYKKDYENLDNN